MIRREERSFEVTGSDHIMPNMTGVELCTELNVGITSPSVFL